MSRVILRYEENLPMPLIFLASADDLAEWYISQLEWAIAHGYRDLSVSCFDTAPMGFDITGAAHAVMQGIATFLAKHSDVESLTILCGDENALRSYGQLLSEYRDL